MRRVTTLGALALKDCPWRTVAGLLRRDRRFAREDEDEGVWDVDVVGDVVKTECEETTAAACNGSGPKDSKIGLG